MIIKKFFNRHNNPYFRSLRFHINYSRITYRYPYRYDNDIFIQKLAKFIEDDLRTNIYQDLNEHGNMFYVDIVDGMIQFIDKTLFDEKEKWSLRNTNKQQQMEDVEKEMEYLKNNNFRIEKATNPEDDEEDDEDNDENEEIQEDHDNRE